MNNRSFSKGFSCGYQWKCVWKIIAFLCFVSIYCTLAGATNTSEIIEVEINEGRVLCEYRDAGLYAASGHFFTGNRECCTEK